jgi:hypothetical protein
MKDWQKLLIALGVCALVLWGAYHVMQVESPASKGFRAAVQRFLEHRK